MEFIEDQHPPPPPPSLPTLHRYMCFVYLMLFILFCVFVGWKSVGLRVRMCEYIFYVYMLDAYI